MKKQSGFTLIELMVVMAIIAILATAGLSAYTGYLKKARDTNRVAALAQIRNIVIGSIGISGSVPVSAATVQAMVTDSNNNVPLLDPKNGLSLCVNSTGTANQVCGYTYRVCDAGTGFAVGARFESVSNRQVMIDDEVMGTVSSTNLAAIVAAGRYTDGDFFELGTCKVGCNSLTTGITGCPGNLVVQTAQNLPTFLSTDAVATST